MVGPAELGIEELQEPGMAQEVVPEASGGEADDGGPFVGFSKAVGDLKLSRERNGTGQGGTADEMDLPLLRTGQVEADRCVRRCSWKTVVVGALCPEIPSKACSLADPTVVRRRTGR